MTAEITFCDSCDASIPASDLERGVAGHSNGSLLCTLCYRGRRRRRLALFLLAPLALLTAAALGAAAAVLMLSGEIEGLRGRVLQLEDRVVRTEAPDAALIRQLERLVEVDREQTAAIGRIGESAAGQTRALAGAVEDVSGQTAVLAAELVALKKRLTEMAGAPEAVGPAPEVDVEWYLALLASADWGARLSGVVGLAEIEDPKVVDALIGVLGDTSSHVRGEAATILGSRRDRRAVAPLVDLLLDENTRVRKNAHKALESILDEAVPFDEHGTEAERKAVVTLLRARLGKD